MTLTTEDVRHLLSQPESERLEFKVGRSVLKNAANMAPIIAGFANSDGGVLLLGHGGNFARARFDDAAPWS